jgi:putative hydrolase of the HAD superfamily
VKITTVLLDAGGVILDESDYEQVRAELAVQVLSRIVPGYSISRYYSDIEEAVKSFSPSAYQFVFWKYLNNNGSLFDKLYATYSEEWQHRKPSLKLTSGLEDEVRAMCKSFKLGIAGQYGKELLRILEKRSILDCFTYHFTQDDFSLTKPDPRYYEQIAKACGVGPQQCIMIGDRIDNDVIPAKQIGMRTILIRVGLHRNQQPRILFEMPDAESNSLLGLTDRVLRVAESL